MSGANSTRAGLREIYRNPYIVLRYDQGRRFLVVTRLPEHYPSIEILRETFAQLDAAMAHIFRPKTVLLIDSRRSPARNDATFEVEFGRLRKYFLRDLQKIATLVQTAVGVLQVARHMRLDEVSVGVFTDVGEALAHLGVNMPPQFVDLPDGT